MSQSRVSARGASKGIVWAGIVLILATGIIHLIEAPGYFGLAFYLGASFILNAVLAVVSAWGVFRDAAWGWWLGIVVSGGALVAFLVSRTVGLPGGGASLAYASFFEPVAVVAFVVEALFVILAAIRLSRG